ncbi:MAG: hypothetical protein K2P81_10165, partial [Bacteriovoracaceae bacterium]|nr:hypothetical protein [Bacteriovoracaceae bacterium]
MATFYQRITNLTRGIRFRLSVVYSALFGVCLVLLSLFITGEYLDFARKEHDQFLRNFAIDLSHFVKPGLITKNMSLDVPLSEKIRYFPFVIQNTVVAIRNLEGHILYTNRKDIDVPFNVDFAKTENYSHRFMNFQTGEDTRMRGINLKIPHEDSPLILQVASTVENLTGQQDRHFYILALIIPFAILISAFISSLVAGQALDPIRAIIVRMEELLEAESYKPLPVPNSGDEIAKLAVTYNVMLSKVKKTLEAQDQFVAHASHQLNTPLAIMRGEL